MKRDLSKQQFEYRARKLGFEKVGFMGYWRLACNSSASVSVFNAGTRNRDRLKYLVACDRRERLKQEAAK